eukprot:5716622-Pleurochrysis_carterae.AAC.1
MRYTYTSKPKTQYLLVTRMASSGVQNTLSFFWTSWTYVSQWYIEDSGQLHTVYVHVPGQKNMQTA